jgi:hypothetical protein
VTARPGSANGWRRLRAALLLVGVCAVPYHVAVSQEATSTPHPGRSSAPHAPLPGATAAAPDADRVNGWVENILARPLFDPSRRPPSVAVAGPAEPRLAGILIGPKGRFALFAGAEDARGTIVPVGGQAGAYKVQAIEADAVSVLGPDGPKRLRPRFARADESGGTGGATSAAARGGPPLPPHPSILDLLRSRAAAMVPAAGEPPRGMPTPSLPPSLTRPPGR